MFDVFVRRGLPLVIAVTLLAVPTVAASSPAPELPAAEAPAQPDAELASAFRATSRSTDWQIVDQLPLDFDAYHPQGLARVGDHLFLSAVEILEPTERYPEPVDGLDRTPGKGVGHLFVLDLAGHVQNDILLGEGDIYHPGGIDADGTSVWIPVAEYRPDSRSIIYRVDATTLEVTELFRADDHVGGVVHDPGTGLLHGVSWGSRRLYSWTTAGQELSRLANAGHFIDYQDCQHVPAGKMLCGGVASIATPDAGSQLELGGLALVDLASGRVLHEVPLQRFSPAGHVVTRNPVLVEADGATLRLWAAPDDGEESPGTTLLVLETAVP